MAAAIAETSARAPQQFAADKYKSVNKESLCDAQALFFVDAKRENPIGYLEKSLNILAYIIDA